jgi:hypothetical protein
LAPDGIEIAGMRHYRCNRWSRPMLRFLKPSLGKAVFGARILFAFALPPLAFAHEAHPSTQAAATSDESSFLRENEAAMTKMMNDIRRNRPAISTATSSP